MTLNVDISKFNEAMATVSDKLGITSGGMGAKFVRYQAGALVQTLIKITPPIKRAQTASKIKKRVQGKFASLSNPKRDFDDMESGGKHGSGEVRWYAWNSTGLYGVARKWDMRKASEHDMYDLLKVTTERGTIEVGRRGKQRVRIWKKILVRRKAVNALIARLVSHIGRLKAGWCVGWKGLGAPKGIYSPPDWVLRHERGARGYYVDGLGIANCPTFSIANTAAGITHQGTIRLVQRALEIRSRAMLADMRNYVKGIKDRNQFFAKLNEH